MCDMYAELFLLLNVKLINLVLENTEKKSFLNILNNEHHKCSKICRI